MPKNFTSTIVKKYNPISTCIYCSVDGVTAQLTKEHIIPYGLGGRLILPEASCSKCSAMTGAFEEHCLKRMFGDSRFYLGIRSRKRGIPRSFPIEVDIGNDVVTKQVSLNDLPAILIMPHFGWIPEILFGFSPNQELEDKLAGTIYFCALRDDFNESIKKIGGKFNMTKDFGILPFGRMLAKIAHSYAVAELGINGFKPLLINFIRNTKPFYPYHLLGGHIIKEPIGKDLHELRIEYRNNKYGQKFVEVRIHLFAPFDMPVYYVVVGEV